MKLYHGTSETAARLALTKGLVPRKVLRSDGNWEIESHPECVYLTVAYAGYFASQASDKDRWAIIEVDTDKLDDTRLVPDEDFLEQATRGQREYSKAGKDVKARTRWFRKRLLRFSHHWQDSIEGLGTCAYYGAIPPEAFSRVAVFEPDSNMAITMAALDPMISLLNYRFVGDRYKAITKWLMGDDVAPEDIVGLGWQSMPAEAIVQFRKELARRDGCGRIL